LFAVPAAGYLIARWLLGYGTLGSGFYQDPLKDTALFISHIPWHLCSLILQGWFTQDPAAWRWNETNWPAMSATGVCLLISALALGHVLKQLKPATRGTMLSLVLGSFLALLPMVAVLPSVRLVGVAMIGIAGVVGVMVDTAWFGRQTEARHGMEELTALTATLLGFAHLIHGPGRGFLNAQQIKGIAVAFNDRTADLARHLKEEPASEIVVVRGLANIFFYGFALEALGVHDTHWTVLSLTGHVLCLRRDETTVDLVVGPDSGLYPALQGDLYRSVVHPLWAGDAFKMGGFDATVLEAGASGARKARFRFSTDVDDPSRIWIGESAFGGFYPAPPPKVGFGTPYDP
jgi:hypothetical protein